MSIIQPSVFLLSVFIFFHLICLYVKKKKNVTMVPFRELRTVMVFNVAAFANLRNSNSMLSAQI